MLHEILGQQYFQNKLHSDIQYRFRLWLLYWLVFVLLLYLCRLSHEYIFNNYRMLKNIVFNRLLTSTEKITETQVNPQLDTDPTNDH